MTCAAVARHDDPVTQGTGGDGGRPRTPGPRRATQVRPPVPDPRRAAVRIAAVVSLLALVVLAASMSGPWQPTLTPYGQEESILPETPPVVSNTLPPDDRPVDVFEGVPEPPVHLGWLWSLVALVLSLALGLAVLHVIRRHQLRDPASDPGSGDDEAGGVALLDGLLPDLGELRSGVAGAAEELQAPARPADAVIAAWVALEASAGRSGVPRHPAATPTEFTVEVLDRTPAEPQAVRTLLALYLRARFGDERLTADDVATATEALSTLARGLEPA